MRIEALDHVALWVADRDALAGFLTRHVGMHVVERTDAFTLVGVDARLGKLTLFAVDGEREPGVLAHVGLRVRDLATALGLLPRNLDVERRARGRAFFDAPGGLRLGLVEAGDEGVDYDFDHVALRVPNPPRTSAELGKLGFGRDGERLTAGNAHVELEHGDPDDEGRPLLNHLGLRVASADEHLEEAKRRGLEIADVVDGRNTYSVFAWGPDRIKLEYVEHKASFSLA